MEALKALPLDAEVLEFSDYFHFSHPEIVQEDIRLAIERLSTRIKSHGSKLYNVQPVVRHSFINGDHIYLIRIPEHIPLPLPHYVTFK